MTIQTMIAEMAERGVTIQAEGESLRLKGPSSILTAEMQAVLRQRKPEILAYLRDGTRPLHGKELLAAVRDIFPVKLIEVQFDNGRTVKISPYPGGRPKAS